MRSAWRRRFCLQGSRGGRYCGGRVAVRQGLPVPVDDHIPGSPPTGNDIQFSILVEISNLEVLTGHLVVIEEVSLPFAFLIPDVNLDTDFPFLVRVAPARDDLERAGSKDVGVFQSVTLSETIIQDRTLPSGLSPFSPFNFVNCSVESDS